MYERNALFPAQTKRLPCVGHARTCNPLPEIDELPCPLLWVPDCVISGMVLLWCEKKVLAAESLFVSSTDKPMLASVRIGQPIAAGTVIVSGSLWASAIRSHPKITLGSISSEETQALGLQPAWSVRFCVK